MLAILFLLVVFVGLPLIAVVAIAVVTAVSKSDVDINGYRH